MDTTVEILESVVAVPDTAGRRARAWARQILRIVDADSAWEDDLSCLVQALITEETNHILLQVEKALLKESM